MVYLHFPSNYTDEEIMLQAKYAKLRKKKKALQMYQNPKPASGEKTGIKRALEPKDAKEMAKKLVLSGKITVNKGQGAKSLFKRPHNLARKLVEARTNAVLSASGFADIPRPSTLTPIKPAASSAASGTSAACSSSSSMSLEATDASFVMPPTTPPPPTPTTPTFGMIPYSPFTPNESEPGTATYGKFHHHHRQNRKPFEGLKFSKDGGVRGNTIHIRGHNISEEIVRSALTPMGNIVHVTMELERSCGFVTFDKVESAERAIKEVHGTSVSDVELSVSFARRQPAVNELSQYAPASATWSALASSQSQKGTHQDKREQVIYDDDA